jgi:hypothetical protein
MISNSSIEGYIRSNKTKEEEQEDGKGHGNEKTTSILKKQQQGQLAKIELDSNTFSPGDTIKGKLYLHTDSCNNNYTNNKTSNIKSIEITLNAIEHVSTYNDDGLKRIINTKLDVQLIE